MDKCGSDCEFSHIDRCWWDSNSLLHTNTLTHRNTHVHKHTHTRSELPSRHQPALSLRPQHTAFLSNMSFQSPHLRQHRGIFAFEPFILTQRSIECHVYVFWISDHVNLNQASGKGIRVCESWASELGVYPDTHTEVQP